MSDANDLKAIREELAALRKEMTALRTERVVHHHHYSPQPGSLLPQGMPQLWPEHWPQPAYPGAPWPATCCASTDDPGTYVQNENGSWTRVSD